MPVPRKHAGVLGLAAAVLAVASVLIAQEAEMEVLQVEGPVISEGTIVVKPAVVAQPPSRPVVNRGPGAPPGSVPLEGPGASEQKPDEKSPGDEKKEGAQPGEDTDKGGEKEDDEKKEPSKPIQRPTEPPEPPDPDEFKVRPGEDGKVQFSFRGQSWPDVLDWLAEISQTSLDWQELPGDYLNLATQRRYTVEEAGDLINRHLLDRGYTMLREGELMSVAKTDKLNASMVPRVAPEELEQHRPYEFVKVSFPLDWLMAQTAVEELKPMLSPNGKLTALSTTNRLEAMDAVINLREIRRLLAEEQSTEGKDRLVKVFSLKHTRASEIRELLLELLGAPSKASKPGGPMSPQQMQQMQEQIKQMAEMAKQQGNKPGGLSKPKADVNLIVDQRQNTIIAYAPPDKMAIVEQAIESLDVPSDHTHSLLRNKERMHVYFLESIEPQPLIKTLQDLGDLDFDTRLEADSDNNAIIAYASLADHMTIRTLIEKLDSGGRRAEVIPLTMLRAETVVEIVDFMMGGGKEKEQTEDDSRRGRMFFPFFGPDRDSSRRRGQEHSDQFRVDADVANNSLLLWCNDFELAKVQNLLVSLREHQKEGTEPNTVRVHRLVTLDPEPFIETLQAMNTLEFHTSLKVDIENNAIIAYASESDHTKIRELITTLDGSGRQFHVIPLRRLDADYVRGTIEFMMAGQEDQQQQSGYSRTYVYNEYYGGGPSRGGEKKADEFRVDADLQYNRLLLWANDIEVKEVRNLLVKLGELPPEGGDSSTIRVLDVMPGPERQKMLEHIRRVWPSLAPNTLVLPPPGESEEEEKKGKAGEQEPVDEASPPPTPPDMAARGPAPPESSNPAESDPGNRRTTEVPQSHSVFRLAMLQQETPQPETPSDDDPQPAVQPEQNAGEETEQGPGLKSQQEPAPAVVSEPLSPGNASDQATRPTVATEEPPSVRPAGSDVGPRPPVSITQAPDGRLIITSEDTKALDQLEDLVMRLAPPRTEYEVFQLKYAEAYWVKWNLEDFFEEEDKKGGSSDAYWAGWYGYPYSSGSSSDSGRRLSKRRPLRFISDDDTNTILVLGADPAQLRTIDELIKLYDQPHLTDSESARRTEVFPIRYSKAAIVAETVKDVYRDLLSENDKALAGGRPQEPRHESRYTYIYGGGGGGGDEGGERKTRRWKGDLSIGVDELSNTLIVSAPEFLFRDVTELIQRLDEAARPVATVRVMKVGGAINASQLQQVLDEVLGQSSGRHAPAEKPPGPRPREGGPTRPNGWRPN
ncbi:MAG: hypothetical protein JXB62_21660 [Pirellulales bacterium]|nr:hypothetical protein [Pirellulales bacterium]